MSLISITSLLSSKVTKFPGHWLNELSKSFIISAQNMLSSSYLRCLAYFPLTWPLPSQPGVGQLRRKHTHTHTQSQNTHSSTQTVWCCVTVATWVHLDLSLCLYVSLVAACFEAPLKSFLAKWWLFGTYWTHRSMREKWIILQEQFEFLLMFTVTLSLYWKVTSINPNRLQLQSA